jgi:predicted MFS family arabinose efflux permease
VSVREVFGLPFKNVPLRLVMGSVVLFVLGHFGAFTFIRPFLEDAWDASPGYITGMLMIYGVSGAIGNFVAGHTAKNNLKGTFIAACTGLVASLLLLLTAGQWQAASIVFLVLWGLSFGAWQLCQINMTLAAAPETFEAAMSLNTLAYNTSIALGALFGGLFADSLGVRSVLWYGVALAAASLLLTLATIRRTTRPARDEALVAGD